MTAPVSLLIPCFNAARFLPRLAESIRAQTTPFAAILCYDDGSTDDTVTVARQLGLEILTGNANRGVSHARNRLAEAARTEWIHFQDADDPLLPNFLERLAPACNAEHDVVSCDADWVKEENGDLLVAWRYDSRALADAPLPHLLQRGMSLNNTIVRRRLWLEVGGCDESLPMWEDADVHIRLARAGARFHHVPEVLSCALRRAESPSHDYRRNWSCRITTLENYARTASSGEVAAVIAQQAEHAAGKLALLGDRATAERALALCRRLGARPPTTHNPLLRVLKTFVPAYTLLRAQARHRERPA